MSGCKLLSIVVCGLFVTISVACDNASGPRSIEGHGSSTETDREAENLVDPAAGNGDAPGRDVETEQSNALNRRPSEPDSESPKPGQPSLKRATHAVGLTTEKILVGLSRSEAMIRNLSVTTKYVKLQKYSLPVEQPVRLEFVTKFVVDSIGRSWHDCVGERVNSGPNGVDIFKGCWQGSFDGNVAKSLSAGEDGKFHWGRMDDYPSWSGVHPLEFTTHYFQKPVSAILKKKGAVVAGEAEWEGRPVTLVESPPVNRAGDKNKRGKYQFLMDPTRNWIVVRRSTLIQFGAGQRWQEYTRIESSQHKEIRPGIWLPMRVKYESLNVTKDEKPEELWSFEGRNEDWKVNQNLPESQFNITFPPGVVVTDVTGSERRSFIVGKANKGVTGKDSETPKKKREPIYDPKADAKAEIAAAVAKAKRDNKRVLVKFGGNWCSWCFKLHDVFRKDGEVAPIIRSEYVLVMVDVNTNRDLLLSYGKDNDKHGYPFLTVLDADGKVLTNQNTSDLESGPEHDVDKVKEFLQKWAPELVDAEQVFKNALASAEVEKKLLLVHLGAPW